MIQKFRPYFTSEELKELIGCLKTHKEPKPQWRPIIKYLEEFSLKIDHGVIGSSIAIKGTKTEQLVKSLDLEGSGASIAIQLETQKKALYAQWIRGDILTPPELDLVQEYRYENDLMTPEQEKDYEKYLMSKHPNIHKMA